MVITRVGPLSCAKIAAALYAVMGLIMGAIFSFVAAAGAFAGASQDTPMFPMMFGAASIVFFPIMYACFGFVGSLIAAALYNLLAGAVGGIELDLQ